MTHIWKNHIVHTHIVWNLICVIHVFYTWPLHCEILSLQVTTNSAPRVESLTAYPDLFRAYLALCPNSKLPIKFHAMSIEAEHFDQGPLFSGPRVSDQAAMVGGCIRNTLVKYRDLAQCSKKQLVIKKQVLLQIFLCATTGSRIYITYT